MKNVKNKKIAVFEKFNGKFAFFDDFSTKFFETFSGVQGFAHGRLKPSVADCEADYLCHAASSSKLSQSGIHLRTHSRRRQAASEGVTGWVRSNDCRGTVLARQIGDMREVQAEAVPGCKYPVQQAVFEHSISY